MLLNCGVKRRLLRVPWTARRSNQSILKEISPEYSLEGLMLKLKLQYFGHLIRRTDSLEKTLMLGKIEGRRRRGRQRMRLLDDITDSMDMGLGDSRSWWWTGRPGVLQFMGSQRVGHDWVTELNWIHWNHFCWNHPKNLHVTKSKFNFAAFAWFLCTLGHSSSLSPLFIYDCSMRDLSSPTRDQTCPLCSVSVES